MKFKFAGKNYSKVEYFQLKNGEENRYKLHCPTVLIVKKGSVDLNFITGREKNLTNAIVVLSRETFTLKARNKTEIFLFYVDNFWEFFPCTRSTTNRPFDNGEEVILPYHDYFHPFLDGISTYLGNPSIRESWHSLKTEELFLLMKSLYTPRQIDHFLNFQVDRKKQFREIVLTNYTKVKSIRELASLTDYSISGFEKRFRNIFGETPKNWLARMKAKSILEELQSYVPIKDISQKLKFSSPSRFNDFCKAKLGATPGNIRREFIRRNHKNTE